MFVGSDDMGDDASSLFMLETSASDLILFIMEKKKMNIEFNFQFPYLPSRVAENGRLKVDVKRLFKACGS